MARKDPPILFGRGIYAHEHLIIVVVKKTNDITSVILGCRFITQYKVDLLRNYERASFERVREMAHLIQPNSGMRDMGTGALPQCRS